MSFANTFQDKLSLVWQSAFKQKRTLNRAIDHAMALASLDRSRTISHTLSARGLDQQDWSDEYKLFSRSEWQPERLMDDPLRYSAQNTSRDFITVALDDTKVKKTGRKIPGVSYQRDALSPPFHANLILASRFLQGAVIVNTQSTGARGLPVCFRETPVVKKPGKRASSEEIAAWKQLKKTQNLSTAALDMIRDLRGRLDELGAEKKSLLLAVDGSFCNRTMMATPMERIHILARCRKDASLALPSKEPRKVYDSVKFTPEQVRKDDSVAWQTAHIHYAGDWRDVRHKEMSGVLWQRGAKRRMLRLIVVAAQPYKRSPNSRTLYREEAYFLTTDLKSPVEQLVQAAFDRWQIEANHREEKTDFGVGEAQVRSPKAVPRHPAFAVAVYSLLHLCALEKYGPTRTDDYLPLPKWRKNAKRPSIQDLKRLLRHEAQSNQPCISQTQITQSSKSTQNNVIMV